MAGNLHAQTRDYPSAAIGLPKLRGPDRWRETQALEVAGPGVAPIAITPALGKIPDHELQREIAMLEAEVGSEEPA